MPAPRVILPAVKERRWIMRLFIAVQLSEDMKKQITGSMHELKQAGVKGNYMAMNNLHMTLAFIGETDRADEIKGALKTLSAKPFRLSLSGFETFGDILVLSVKGNQGLSAVSRNIRTVLDEAGIPYDRKPFRPHITVIRKMHGRWQSVKAPKGEMTVSRISLMKTTFRDGKPFYTEVFAVNL